MKVKLLFVFILMLASLQLFAGESKAWYGFEEGIQLATKEGKHVVIDFYTDWCKWCKVMDKETFSVPEVESYLFEHFVPIRINAEGATEKVQFQGQSFTFRELTSAFRVTGFPSIAFMTPTSEIITVIPGYIKKDMFLNILKYVNEECYKSQITLDEFIEKGCPEPEKK